MKLERIQKAIEEGRYIITVHARQQMFERDIDLEDVKHAIRFGEIKAEDKKRIMLCDFCGGEMIHKITEVKLESKNKSVLIKDVPAYVCRRCGEKYLDSEVSEKIEKLLNSGRKVTREITIPVFEMNYLF